MGTRTAFVAAPLLLCAYGVIRVIDGLDGSRGPGVAWTTGHLAFLGAMLLFVPVFEAMRSMAGSGALATVSTIVGLAGIATLSAQFAIDIVVGFMAADKPDMSELIDRVQAVPGVMPVVYDGGPVLFYVGQLALVVQLAAIGRVRFWTPVLVLVDSLVPFVDKNLIPIGAVLLLVSFIPFLRRPAAPSAPTRRLDTEQVGGAGSVGSLPTRSDRDTPTGRGPITSIDAG